CAVQSGPSPRPLRIRFLQPGRRRHTTRRRVAGHVYGWRHVAVKEVVRVASGQGFWGDQIDAPRQQIAGGPIDYLMLDYLAEVTMSILQKQRSRDPSAGYAHDFVPLIAETLADLVRRD